MATDNGVLTLGWEAAEDLSDDQYRGVVLASEKVRRPDSGTERVIGILQNAPESGEAASVMVMGKSKIELGATVAEGAYMSTDYVDATTGGRGVAVATVTDGSMLPTLGLCIKGGDVGELGEILLPGITAQVTLS